MNDWLNAIPKLLEKRFGPEAIDQWLRSALYCVHSMAEAKGKKGRYLAYRRPFDEHCDYCLTPPITPPINFRALSWNSPLSKREGGETIGLVPKPRLCIVCGRVHITSQDCPIPEPHEVHHRDSVPRRHDGYTLQRARNMGVITDEDG